MPYRLSVFGCMFSNMQTQKFVISIVIIICFFLSFSDLFFFCFIFFLDFLSYARNVFVIFYELVASFYC